jgi:integrase
VVRAKRSIRVPVVLSRGEVVRLLSRMQGREWLMASLLYGSGLRLMEVIRLRVKDVDFERWEITVRSGKGNKDRVLPLGDPAYANLPMDAPDSMANYSNFALACTKFTVATKLDDDHIAIPDRVAKLEKMLRQRGCRLGQEMLCVSGFNLFQDADRLGVLAVLFRLLTRLWALRGRCFSKALITLASCAVLSRAPSTT